MGDIIETTNGGICCIISDRGNDEENKSIATRIRERLEMIEDLQSNHPEIVSIDIGDNQLAREAIVVVRKADDYHIIEATNQSLVGTFIKNIDEMPQLIVEEKTSMEKWLENPILNPIPPEAFSTKLTEQLRYDNNYIEKLYNATPRKVGSYFTPKKNVAHRKLFSCRR